MPKIMHINIPKYSPIPNERFRIPVIRVIPVASRFGGQTLHQSVRTGIKLSSAIKLAAP